MQALALGLAIGLGIAFLIRAARGSSGGGIFIKNGVRFWDQSAAGALRTELGRLAATPHEVSRVWSVGVGLGTSALSVVRGIQGRGMLATATENMLTMGASPKGIAEISPAEATTLAPASGNIAVLPPL